MFAHWRLLADLLETPITPIVGGTLEGIIESEGMIPNFRARFCTRLLKINPFAAWMMRQTRPVVSYVGIRADEPEREAGDYTKVPGATVRFPLREWGWNIGHVIAYNAERGVTIPIRTDCAWCFWQTLASGSTCGATTSPATWRPRRPRRGWGTRSAALAAIHGRSDLRNCASDSRPVTSQGAPMSKQTCFLISNAGYAVHSSTNSGEGK